MDKARAIELFEKNWPRYLEEYKELLRFPTISTQPDHDKDCVACAKWLRDHLAALGMKARLVDIGPKPLVLAERPGKTGRPTVLAYGHYDVQPVDPTGAWSTPPFEPEIREGRIYARGAVDNKGQFFYVIKAIEALMADDALNCTIKIILEGEEESGSSGIDKAIEGMADELAADILLVTDTEAVAPRIPTIIMGLRGIIGFTVSLKGPSHDLHSGIHGGVAPNPATAMAHLLATLHGPDGSIAIEGFHDGLEEPTDRERELANSRPVDKAEYKALTGVPPVAGEANRSHAERLGFRPCLDVNGISSGYNGPGGKTIIPSEATAKVTARLVPGQDDAACMAASVRHLEMHAPAGLALSITDRALAGSGIRLNSDSVLVQRASRILREVCDNNPAYLWEGASIPIIGKLAEIAGAEPLLVGFGLEQDRMHAPNESFSLDQFKLGYLYASAFLSQM